MKKIIVLILLLAGAAGTVFHYVRHAAAPAAGTEYYADYLPADAVAAVTVLDMQGMAKAFPESALGRFLAKPVMRAIMAEQGAEEERLRQYEDFYDGVADIITNPFIQQLFGDDLTFALLAPDMAHLKTEPEAEGKRRIIAFGSSAMADLVASVACLTLSGFSKETVNGLELTRILLDDNEYLYGYAKDGVIIVAFSPKTIADALKQKTAGGGLSANPAFATAKKFWAESGDDRSYGKLYANLQQINNVVAASGRPEAEKAVAYLQGIRNLSTIAVEHQGDVQVRSRADYEPQQLRADKNLALHVLTGNTLLYSWFSGLSQHLFSFVDPAQYQAMDAAVRQQLDWSIQDVLAAAGPQAGLTVSEVVNVGLFPLPKLVLFAQIQQPKMARKLVDRLRQKMAERGLSEKVTESNGHPIYSWSLLPTEAAHPALALTDTMLYFANGEAVLKALLAEEDKGLPSPARDLLGTELSAQFSTANSSAFAVRPALLAAEAQKVANWAAMAFSATGSQSAKQLREALVKLMQSLDLAAGWAKAEDDHAISILVFRRKAV